jgi:purine-binding chemotaxis protein CheW
MSIAGSLPLIQIMFKSLLNVTKKRRIDMDGIGEELSGREISGGKTGRKGKEGKYLTFTLKDEGYGIDILKVKEIIGMIAVTTIPQTPSYVKGVINLRGKVIPVIDLRVKFGIEETSYTNHTSIIVVDMCGGNKRNTLIGIVVDAVSEVSSIRESEIESMPDFGTKINADYILGLAKTNNGVKILLHIDTVLSTEEIPALCKAA